MKHDRKTTPTHSGLLLPPSPPGLDLEISARCNTAPGSVANNLDVPGLIAMTAAGNQALCKLAAAGIAQTLCAKHRALMCCQHVHDVLSPHTRKSTKCDNVVLASRGSCCHCSAQVTADIALHRFVSWTARRNSIVAAATIQNCEHVHTTTMCISMTVCDCQM